MHANLLEHAVYVMQRATFTHDNLLEHQILPRKG